MKDIGFGTAAIGRPQYINIRESQTETFELNAFREKGIEMLESAYEQGIRYFDTAPGYGMAEKLLIDWVSTKGDASIEIATKWGYAYVADFDPEATVHEVKDHSLDLLNKQWEVSKELLPHLSTLQIHSATFETGVLDNKAVIQRMTELKSEFHIKMGLTTTGNNQVDVLKKAIENPLFEVFQITYNVFDQSLLEISDLIINSGKRIVIKEALANGRVFPNANYPEYAKLYEALNKLAKRYKVGVDAVAIRFCLDTVNPFKVLSGASVGNQLSENLEATQFMLSSDEVSLLKSFKVDPSEYWDERKQLTWN